MVNITETSDAPVSADTPYTLSVGDIFMGTIQNSEPLSPTGMTPEGETLTARADVVELTLEAGSYSVHIGGAASGAGTLDGITYRRYDEPNDVGTDIRVAGGVFGAGGDFTGSSAADVTLGAGTYYFLIGGSTTGTYQFAVTELDGDTGFGTPGESLFGTIIDDVIVGTSGDDTITSGAGDDVITGDLGSDDISGGSGTDTAIFAGEANDFTIAINSDGTLDVIDRTLVNEIDAISSVEVLEFADGEIVDLDAITGILDNSTEDLDALIEMYIAYFNRAPDAVGLYFWGSAFANGTSLEDIAELFLNQDETREIYTADATNLDFATQVYSNVLGRTPDQDGLDFWQEQLDIGNVTRGGFILEVVRGAKADPGEGSTQEFIDLQLGDQSYLAAKTDIGTYYAVIKGLSDVTEASSAMQLYSRGDVSSIQEVVDQIDLDFADASSATDGDLLLPLVGVVDDPFAV